MKRWFSIGLPVCILFMLIFWRVGQKNAETAAQMQQRAARMSGPAIVTLATVERRDIRHIYEATGSVEAPHSVKIAPKITGRIEYLDINEGDRVKKGQVLVRIDDSDVEASVQQQMAEVAEAQYRLAQAQLNQIPADVAVNTQIRQQKATLESAEADHEQAIKSTEAQLEAANAALSDTESKIENAGSAIKSAQANLDNARTKYERINNLYRQGFVSAQEVDDAKAAVKVQEAALEITQGQLKSAAAQRDAARQQYNVVKAKGKADVEAARAKLNQTRASLDYAQANISQKGAYRQNIAALKAVVAAAQASLRSAQSKRRDAVLISPLDGYVNGRYADPGAIASPTQPILSVQFVKQVWVTVSVPEKVCSKLHLGQPAQIRFDALPGRTFDASIIQINPSADPESRQFTVRSILSNTSNLLKPGMFAHVTLETDRVSGAVVVPREAVQRGPEGAFVVTLDSKKTAKRVPVSPQGEDENYICIGDALQPGEKVVALSSMPIKDGQPLVEGGAGQGRGDEHGGRKSK